MPDLRRRVHTPEMMDDLSIGGEPLTKSLEQLRLVNRLLGGYGAVHDALMPYMTRNQSRLVRVLDVGSGIGDIPAYLLQETGIRRWDTEFVGVDWNVETVEYAAQYLRRALDPSVANRISMQQADAADLPFADGDFDVAMASMFLHHFSADDAADIVWEMARVSGGNVLINDLQRHEFAYFGIKALTRLLPAAEMVRHDAPLSVARGFTAAELYRIARKAGLRRVRIRWHWAFRWVLTSGSL